MSQATQMGHRGSYVPTSDAIGRHGYGITKSRKTASTGGGRAWSEEETRLQKMPYKHIAAHLKKTELACRLHYHQLSHGSSRRKRAASMSSGGSSSSHPSPIPRTSMIHPRSTSTAPRASGVVLGGGGGDYGVGANPVVLEKAWCGAGVTGTGDFGRGGGVGATQTPISPVGSHEEYLCGSGGVGGGNKGAQGQGQGQGKQDRTRISAILGIDANPRSPSERRW
ncbi:hypothetical protein N0V88_007820 [Collariella sp. IMI 366227]|nr:hypothetical protein N0V88_007820 [Collariella sp. IMI 366227]